MSKDEKQTNLVLCFVNVCGRKNETLLFTLFASSLSACLFYKKTSVINV